MKKLNKNTLVINTDILLIILEKHSYHLKGDGFEVFLFFCVYI